jgi:methanogenic corrinoid protein MtbC1
MIDLLERYTNAAIVGDRPTAAELAARLLRDDSSAEAVIRELLAPSQVEIGRRWLERACSVGHEHTATFITESVLASLTVGLEPPLSKGRLVMVCADGEWHGLPARMAAELLMLQGWQVVFLGPATPTDHLRTYLADVEADAVAVSCSVAANLPGAARTVRVARHLGFTVVVGGRAFGTNSMRARAIGADGWLATVPDDFDLDRVVWKRVPEPSMDADWARIESERLDIVRHAVRWLSEHHPAVIANPGSWLEHIISDLDEIVRFTAAAELCNDPSILSGYRSWLAAMLASAGLPEAAVTVGFDAVAAVLETIAPHAAQMVVNTARARL